MYKGISVNSFDEAKTAREAGSHFMPKFDDKGLLTAIVVDVDSQQILMVAHMNAEALEATRNSNIAHFYSRSRQNLWMKGETSGNVLNVEEMLVDCDQDAIVLKVKPAGPACHTGETSCFYRRLSGEVLVRVTT